MTTVNSACRYRIRWLIENDSAVRDLLKDCGLSIVWCGSRSYEGYASLDEQDLTVMRLGNRYIVMYQLRD